MLAAGGDEVSAAIAALFSGHAHAYQALSAQAASFHQQFVQSFRGSGNGAWRPTGIRRTAGIGYSEFGRRKRQLGPDRGRQRRVGGLGAGVHVAGRVQPPDRFEQLRGRDTQALRDFVALERFGREITGPVQSQQ